MENSSAKSQLASLTSSVSGVRENALLESALEQPFMSFDGKNLYPMVQTKAARLALELAKNSAMT